MNKQEAIGYLEELKVSEEKLEAFQKHEQYFLMGKNDAIKYAVGLIEKIDEPEKVKIPQFVADWIENRRQEGYNLQEVLDVKNFLFDEEDAYRKPANWMWHGDEENEEFFDIVARAWLDGYEIERPKKYIVQIPDPGSSSVRKLFLGKTTLGNKIKIVKKEDPGYYEMLTEEEIKEKYDWAWQFAKEVER